MAITLLEKFFNNFSLPTIIIAGIVCIIYCVIYCLLKDKMPKFIKIYAPFLLSIFLSLIYDMIFVSKRFVFTQSAFYAGVLSGSLSIIFTYSLKKIIRGERLNLSSTALLIEGILASYLTTTNPSNLAIILEQLLDQYDENEIDNLKREQVAIVIRDNTEEYISESDLYNIAGLIISAVCSLDKTE